MSRSEIEILLEKYLNGTISFDEAEKLRRLSNLCDDNELKNIFSKQWNDYEVSPTFNMPEIQDISERLYQPLQSRRKVRFIHQWMRVAVSLLLLITIGLSVYLLVDNRKMSLLGEREIVVRVDKGQRVGITLPDGSTVRLNSESVLSYRQDFGKYNREVKFSGEGYFEVTKDPTKKFLVNTQFMNVEVLGTSFNFYAYESKEEVELTLIEGRISLSTNTTPAQTAVLEPNSKAIYDKNAGILKVVKTNTIVETVWCSNELVFHSEALEHVLSKIERRYGVVVHVEKKNILKETYTGVFDKEDLIDVMEILSTHFDFSYQVEGDTVIVK